MPYNHTKGIQEVLYNIETSTLGCIQAIALWHVIINYTICFAITLFPFWQNFTNW
jgi:hypothetical protein